MLEASGLFYPNRFARALFQALEQTTGPGGLGGVLEMSGLVVRYGEILPPDNMDPGLDFVEVSAFCKALESIYGSLGGRGIALRVGMGFYDFGVKGVGVLKGITTPEFQSLPIQAKVQISLMGLATVLTSTSSQECHVEETARGFRFIVNPSPFAWERTSDKPVCHIMTGAIKSALRDATDGYEFNVYETTCRSTGMDECVFLVNKEPIGRV